MEIGATEYRMAAEEHLAAAGHCHLNGNYLTCHYLCGLAVECILRAYRWRRDSAWDGRHVLPRLYKESGFDHFVASGQIDVMATNMTVVTTRWSNSHRYASRAKLLRHLNDVEATVNVRGDKLKKNSAEMYDAAVYVVQLGMRKWNN